MLSFSFLQYISKDCAYVYKMILPGILLWEVVGQFMSPSSTYLIPQNFFVMQIFLCLKSCFCIMKTVW